MSVNNISFKRIRFQNDHGIRVMLSIEVPKLCVVTLSRIGNRRRNDGLVYTVFSMQAGAIDSNETPGIFTQYS